MRDDYSNTYTFLSTTVSMFFVKKVPWTRAVSNNGPNIGQLYVTFCFHGKKEASRQNASASNNATT